MVIQGYTQYLFGCNGIVMGALCLIECVYVISALLPLFLDSALLPLFLDSAHSVAMIKHSRIIVCQRSYPAS